MNKIKKLIGITIALTLSLSVAACGNSTKKQQLKI